jgi:hypothetical protein
MDKEATKIELLKSLAAACLDGLDAEIRRGLKYRVLNESDHITLTLRVGSPRDPEGLEFITTRPARLAAQTGHPPPKPKPITQ